MDYKDQNISFSCYLTLTIMKTFIIDENDYDLMFYTGRGISCIRRICMSPEAAHAYGVQAHLGHPLGAPLHWHQKDRD